MTRKVTNINGAKIYQAGTDDLDTCRTCYHFRFLHISEYKEPTYFMFDQRCDPQTDHGCDCKEYIPKDNLQYLEYLYDKKKA